ncbi:hypothetical protein BZG82_07280 [Salinivibrio sp. PR5]|nr:hypothetical protein BZG82_07280 [Salinivibrio sp. PR5]
MSMHCSLNEEDRAVIRGNLDVIGQAQKLLDSLSDTTYSQKKADGFTSTIGQHMRHALDVYVALKQGEACGDIDADRRRRGHLVEHDRQMARKEWQWLAEWLQSLSHQQLHRPVHISTQVTLYSTNTVCLSTTLMRELIVVASHATHHFAMIRSAAYELGEVLDEHIGVAAATASYERDQLRCAR